MPVLEEYKSILIYMFIKTWNNNCTYPFLRKLRGRKSMKFATVSLSLGMQKAKDNTFNYITCIRNKLN